MIIDILTIFPEMVASPLEESILGKAVERGFVAVRIINIRDFAADRRQTTDDRPYGGGSGTVQDPYRIETVEQLNTIGLYRQDYDKHFILMADVAFDVNVPFNVIGSEETPFTGSFRTPAKSASGTRAAGPGRFGRIPPNCP